MTSQLIINSQIEATTEEVGDRWAAVQDQLGLYAYGATPEEASSRLLEAVNLLVETLMQVGGLDAVQRRFDKAGLSLNVNNAEQGTGRRLPLTLTFAKTIEHA